MNARIQFITQRLKYLQLVLGLESDYCISQILQHIIKEYEEELFFYENTVTK